MVLSTLSERMIERVADAVVEVIACMEVEVLEVLRCKVSPQLRKFYDTAMLNIVYLY